MEELENDDFSKSDQEMIAYWIRKYTAAKNHNERREIRSAAVSFMDEKGTMLFLDECLKWHSDIMDKSIFKG